MSKKFDKSLDKFLVDKEVKMSKKENDSAGEEDIVLEESSDSISIDNHEEVSKKEEVSDNTAEKTGNNGNNEVLVKDILIDVNNDFDETLARETESFMEDSFKEDDTAGEEEASINILEEENIKDAIFTIASSISEEDETETAEDNLALETEDEMDDDELFLLSKDQLKFKDDEITIIQQMDNVVTWEIDNLYKKNGKLRSRRSLKSEPPLFAISSSDGDVAEFMVTKEMSYQLYQTFGIIYKSYFGLDGRDKEENPFKVTYDKFKSWANKHPVKLGFLAVFCIALITVIIMGIVN